jgi:hypothetical protein
MSTLSADEQELFDVAAGALPRWLFQDNTPQDLIGEFAKVMQMSRAQAQTWLNMAYIRLATGFWLDQHARDRGTSRRLNESDADLQTRLRSYQDTVTAPAILIAVNAALLSSGIVASCRIWEARRDQGYLHSSTNKMFYTRGWRYGLTNHNSLVVVLPPNVTSSVYASIQQLVRQLAAGGVDTAVDISYLSGAAPAHPFAKISIRPVAGTKSVSGGGTITFDAASGSTHNNSLFDWPVLNPAYGSVSSVGVYTPPATLPADGTIDVPITIELAGNPAQFATARVRLVA